MTPRERLVLRCVIDVCAMLAVGWTLAPWSMLIALAYGGWCYYLGYTHKQAPQ